MIFIKNCIIGFILFSWSAIVKYNIKALAWDIIYIKEEAINAKNGFTKVEKNNIKDKTTSILIYERKIAWR